MRAMTKSAVALARETMTLATRALPRYSSHYSRHDYTSAQLLTLLVLKQFLQTDYRGLVTLVAEWGELRRALLDGAALRNYWDGEDTGLPHGRQPPADAEIQLDQPGLAPKLPVSADAVPWEDSFVAEKFGGQAKHLTAAAVGEGWHVGMLIEAPAPGKRLCPRHYHMLEEEHALVLEGEVTLLLGDERHVMKAGDYVCFPAGRKVGHSFLNRGSGPCRYLMIGERHPNEVCVYPDSNKLAVDALRTRQNIFDMAGTREYWDGEA